MRDYSNDCKSFVIIKYLDEKETFKNMEFFFEKTDTPENVTGH